jgi:hypothetical protein
METRKSFEEFMFGPDGHRMNSMVNSGEMSVNRFGWEVWQAAISSTTQQTEPKPISTEAKSP